MGSCTHCPNDDKKKTLDQPKSARKMDEWPTFDLGFWTRAVMYMWLGGYRFYCIGKVCFMWHYAPYIATCMCKKCLTWFLPLSLNLKLLHDCWMRVCTRNIYTCMQEICMSMFLLPSLGAFFCQNWVTEVYLFL
jgi:hypothetical protein